MRAADIGALRCSTLVLNRETLRAIENEEFVMGEANRRGSFDERKAQAQRDNAGAFKLIERGEAPHYAFIIDRSPKGLQLLGALKKGPDEVRERVGSPAVQLWEASHFPYVVIWGTWGWSGGLTVQALDLQNSTATSINVTLPWRLYGGDDSCDQTFTYEMCDAKVLTELADDTKDLTSRMTQWGRRRIKSRSSERLVWCCRSAGAHCVVLADTADEKFGCGGCRPPGTH